MSLQRIFNVARKLGTPVIVTDADGREPLVVLPLDQFEAMAGVSTDPVGERSPAHPSKDADAFVRESKSNVEIQAVNKQRNIAHKAVQTPVFEEPSAIKVLAEELSTEERFYLEPLEGEETV